MHSILNPNPHPCVNALGSGKFGACPANPPTRVGVMRKYWEPLISPYYTDYSMTSASHSFQSDYAGNYTLPFTNQVLKSVNGYDSGTTALTGGIDRFNPKLSMPTARS